MKSYKDFSPDTTSRKREDIEWSITYTFNTNETDHPRVLLIGDSICNGYQTKVRDLLSDCANVTFWASSKCVTDRQYFRELDFLLDANRYDLISFNNGLHSLDSDRSQWIAAYESAVTFIREKCPKAKLVLTLCTPLNDVQKDAVSRQLNEITCAIAQKHGLPTLDLYAAVADLDKDTEMSDAFHWYDRGRECMARVINEYARSVLDSHGQNVQTGTETGPDGAMK